ncbi:MAG: transglutaminase-like domain-containing protein [Methylomonas sp.]|jgi:hypothetical protein
MSLSQHLSRLIGLFTLFSSITANLPAQAATATAAETAETTEIVFNPSTNSQAQQLNAMAGQLGNAVSIYQYVYNNYQFSTYHGSRSGSINTFAGQRGSDVDIATTLIAMLRSQHIPARYAVGNIKLSAAQVTNWLGMDQGGNAYVAGQILVNQGIQNLAEYVDSNNNIVYFYLEHVWVEALVPFAQYRGLSTGAASVDCTQPVNANLCIWVPLDASFKQMTYNGLLSLDPYTNSSAYNASTGTYNVNSSSYDVSTQYFDYTGYYKAIVDNTTNLLNKNPLTILEESISSWLRSAYPGKTLEDVADEGQIIPINDGLLPASLPYQVVSNIRNYDCIVAADCTASHDAAVPAVESAAWAKYVTVGVNIPTTTATTTNPLIGNIKLNLAMLNTQPLTLTATVPSGGGVPTVQVLLGGNSQAFIITSPTATAGNKLFDLFTINVSMDGAPAATSGDTGFEINATYNAEIGGYYLVATGGESSNWAQVHNAAAQLLANDALYPITFNPGATSTVNSGLACSAANSVGCTPYLNNGLGYTTSNELINNPTALNALTGGLLYVAASQYYANQRDMFNQADYLMKTISPIMGFIGVVSSQYGAEYIDSTAFSIQPQGLLIDMKGITLAGTFRAYDTPYQNIAMNNYSNSQLTFLGHIMSSLEHETWQALTGFDAISTVRGFQRALTQTQSGSTLTSLAEGQNKTTAPTNNTVASFINQLVDAATSTLTTAYPQAWITNVENNLNGSSTTVWIDYTCPTTMVSVPSTVSNTAPSYYTVDLRRAYSTINNITTASGSVTPILDSLSFEISY